MGKKLIFKDKNGEGSFLTNVNDTRDRANELISLYNNSQEWEKITTLEDWQGLVIDPQAYFDRALIENIKIVGTGGRLPSPEKLAELFEVPREDFMNLIKGIVIDEAGCIPCKKKGVKVRRGKACIASYEYENYQEFLRFSGFFTIDKTRVEEHLKTFEKYTQTDKELEIANYWEGVVEMLNNQVKRGYWGPTKLQEACKLFGQKYADNTAYISEEAVFNEIMKIRGGKL